MKELVLKYLFLIAIVLTGHLVIGQGDSQIVSVVEKQKDSGYHELSAAEWKKFRNFEKKLTEASPVQTLREKQLSAYTRDSLQILEVKLMAIMLLEEKELLDRDIAENLTYYHSLLEELRVSSISPSEYRFLEEKLAYLNQGVMEEKLALSRTLILILVFLCIAILLFAFRVKTTQKNTATPELSKQEITVRNLILQGKTNKEIASELFISLSTVKTHITNLYGKLNITNRAELFQKHTGTST